MTKRAEQLQHYTSFQGRQIDADYREVELDIYGDNPLIAALPPLLEPEQLAHVLAKYPDFDPAQRTLSTTSRLSLLRQAKRFYQPVQQSIELGLALNTMLRDSYQDRNPLKLHQRAQRRQMIETIDWENIDEFDDDGTQTDGIIIVGLSGVGKTRSLRRNLAYIPQVITHRRYQKQTLILQQISWLIIDCPARGTIWGLCSAFFAAIDRVLGTKYMQFYVKERTKSEVLIKGMASVAEVHALGMLVVDEIQNLQGAREGRELLNFLVQLSNELKIPIVLIGTFKAEQVLTHAFRITRRGSGYGSPIWKALVNRPTTSPSHTHEWELFLEALWQFQYIQQPVELDDRLSEALYDVSAGIIDLAIKIFIASQRRAILKGTEKLTSGLIRSVARDEFPWTGEAVAALKIGTKTALLKYEDLYHRHSLNDVATGVSSKPVRFTDSQPAPAVEIIPEFAEQSKSFNFEGTSLMSIANKDDQTAYDALHQANFIYAVQSLIE